MDTENIIKSETTAEEISKEEEKAKKKRVRRTIEERVAEIDAKIENHKNAIQKLEQKKQEILHPQIHLSKAAGLKKIMIAVQNKGMENEEIAKRLDLNYDEVIRS